MRKSGFRVEGLGFRVIAIAIFLLTAYSLQLTAYCYAEVVSSAELIEHAKDYDGKIVEYQGEVVGDIMVRGEGAWVNVNDGITAIGIWTDAGIKERITYAGSYKYTGDNILAIGEFHRACHLHGGDLDIHAKEIHILKIGQRIEHPFSKRKLSTAVILAVVAGILIFVDLIWKRKF